MDSPEPEALTGDELAYITGFMNRLENAVCLGDEAFVEENLDLDSYIDYYLIQEASKNGDAYASSSTYMYKERNGKLYFGPLWDFDYVAWSGDRSLPGGFRSTDDAPWMYTFLQDGSFRERLEERWKVLRDLMLEEAADGGGIDSYARQIRLAQIANYYVSSTILWDEPVPAELEMGVWEQEKDIEGPFTREEAGFSEEVGRLKDWVRERAQWIDESIGGLRCSSAYLEFVSDGELILVRKEDRGTAFDESNVPEPPKKEGFRFAGWYRTDENGNETGLSAADTEDEAADILTYTAKWEEYDAEAELKSLAFCEEVIIADSFYMDLVDLLVTEPEDFDRSSITFTLEPADSDFAFLNESSLTFSGSGEVTVTAACGSRTASCRIVREAD